MEESLASSIVTETKPPLNLVASRHFPLTLIIPAYEMHTSLNRNSNHIVRTRSLGKNIILTHCRGSYLLKALEGNFA